MSIAILLTVFIRSSLPFNSTEDVSMESISIKCGRRDAVIPCLLRHISATSTARLIADPRA